MPIDRQSRISEIVAAAQERAKSQREAFLREACSEDNALRTEVERRLAQGEDEQPTVPVSAALQTTQAHAGHFMGGSGGGSTAPLTEGTRLGPYEIESRIGVGGMGVVYKARDLRLGRHVAIKVIQSGDASPILEPALLREARLTSSLNHPGIVTVYDILFDGGMTCIVMELIEGSPLLRLIPQDGFAVDRALSLAMAIGDAIAVAHAAGVIHRDLKPANILVREDGQIKILDFGLATLARRSTPERATQAESLFGGSAVGTIGYMAPEQARGESVNERADIFSFGVILFQMLTGKLPFAGANAIAVLHAMQSNEPASLRNSRPGMGALERVVRCALARKPEERYRTIREMLADLTAASGKSASVAARDQAAAPTIAVLPLVNISPDPENEYICDGLAEELINGLTQIPSLRVVSRSSSFQCKGTTPDVRETGRRLGADLLVHGSLRRAANQLRLTMQLSETGEGYQVWSQRFDAQIGNLFALQDELTAAVLEKLRQQLGARFPGVDSGQKMPNSEAYDLYLQGRFEFNRETPADFLRALDLFQRSAAEDSSFAAAFIGIAETHMRLDWYGLEPASVAVPAVKSALETALRLQPDSVAGLCNLAIAQAGWDWDWNAAGGTFARALAVGEGLASVHFHHGLDFLTPLGRLEEALKQLQRALELDPLSPIVRTAVGGCLYRMRRFGESAETLRATLRSNPEFGHAHWSLARVLLEIEQPEEALAHFEAAASIMGHIPAAQSELGYCHARMGRRDLAHCIVQDLQRRAQQEWVSPLSEALVYVGLGEENAAMQRLEDAFEKRIRQLIWVNVDPRYDSMRRNPGFQALIARLGLSPLQART